MLPFSLEDILVGARLLRDLPSFLRSTLTREEARLSLQERLANREKNFLALVREAVYENPASPYLPLLKLARLEYGDLEQLVLHEGVEASLERLLQEGVYLTVDEFKASRPVVRHGLTIQIDPLRFRNPLARVHMVSHSSGSHGRRRLVGIDLASILDHAVNLRVYLDTRGGIRWSHAQWAVPGGSAMQVLLRYHAAGYPLVQWFSQLDARAAGLHPRYAWSERALQWAQFMTGVPLVSPRHVPVDTPHPILNWMAKALDSGNKPHLLCFASSALRLCQAALDAGVSLEGVEFWLSGEPTTAKRLEAIRATGAHAFPRAGSNECAGPIGYGCLAPTMPDEMHLLRDLHAVIQPGQAGEKIGVPPTALFLSSLRKSAPLVLLNVSLGDQAVVSRRRCGCGLEELGWTTHFHTLRSHEKLTTAGMTFMDADLAHVLETVLPSRIGGTATDYQLVEQEDETGRGYVTLRVSPDIGAVDAETVKQTFISAIGGGDGAEYLMGLVLKDTDSIRVERRAPVFTATGKILHRIAGTGFKTAK